CVWSDRRNNRDETPIDESHNCFRANINHIANKSQVHFFSVNEERVAFLSSEQSRVSASQPCREWAVLINPINDLGIYFSGEHHSHNPHGLGGCYSVAALKLVFYTQAVEHFANLWPSPVYYHGFE